jgi:hypothetical protein
MKQAPKYIDSNRVDCAVALKNLIEKRAVNHDQKYYIFPVGT